MTELERQALEAELATHLASAQAIAAKLALGKTEAAHAIPVGEFIKAGDAAILLQVSKKTIIRRCREGQGKRIGGRWYMRGSFAIGLECPGSVRSQRND